MKKTIALMTLASACASVQADDTFPDMTRPESAIAKRYYVAPMADYTFASSHRFTDDGLGGRLVVGKQLVQGLHLEIQGLYEHYKGNDGGAEKLVGGGVNALVFPSTTFSGFFGSAGVSYAAGSSNIVTKPDSSKDSTLWDLGVGYLIGPFKWLNDGGLRLEARGQADQKHIKGAFSDFAEPVLSAGLLIPIGKAPTPPPVAAPVPAGPVDTDGDGVFDDKDQCPGTPPGTAVDAVGCPLPPPPPSCKSPEAGQKVDLSGCAVNDSVILRGVNFDLDKSTLTANAKIILDGLADSLKAVPAIHVELGGHTDSQGTDAYNLKLSDRRAASVKKYLVGHGIDADRMTTKGYGETQPIADNTTEEGRALNRRVELKITAGQGAAVAPMAPSEGAAPVEASTPAEPAPAAMPAGPQRTVNIVPAGSNPNAPPPSDQQLVPTAVPDYTPPDVIATPEPAPAQ